MDPATIMMVMQMIGQGMQAMQKPTLPPPDAGISDMPNMPVPQLMSQEFMARGAAPGVAPPGGGQPGTPFEVGTNEAHQIEAEPGGPFEGTTTINAAAPKTGPAEIKPRQPGAIGGPPGGGEVGPGAGAANQKMTVSDWLESIGGAAQAGAALAPQPLQPPQPADFAGRAQVGGMSPISPGFMTQPRSVAEFLQLLMRR